MNGAVIEKLSGIVGGDYVITEPDQKLAYMYDEIELAVRPLANEDSVVVKPANAEETAGILRLANAEKIPVVVRGGGTGLSGAAIPVRESVVISMERLNKIIEIDKANRMAVLEAGVTLAALLEE
ncbi:MAG: FAD-binding oxidoreductase, partial [Defluviitaleaceae bacterium]|nr:FAD-binding oxidoreductase [Defluviitaleaceae bacterium]